MPSSSPALAISLNGVDLTLGNGEARVHVLKDVNMAVGAGESVGIVGRSGSGKSTLLMVLAGLERADSGEIHLAGQRIDGLGEDALAGFRGRHVGIVFQSFHLLPTMTALENVAVPLELAGVANAMRKARAELQAVGLGDRLDHFPAQMSGGEQQRVAIARALVAEPSILVADEPTGNLDSETGQMVQDLLFGEAARRGTTLVVVTHDPLLAARCRRRFVMRSGVLHEESAA